MEAPDWPVDYTPGPFLHLHALGVIAMNIGSFEANIDALYFQATGREGLPRSSVLLHYYKLDEAKRLGAVHRHFSVHEKDAFVVKLVDNLLAYFRWSKDCRNHLLHSELYPPGIAGTWEQCIL